MVRLLRAMRAVLCGGAALLQWCGALDSASVARLSTLASSAYVDVAYLLAVAGLYVAVSASVFAPLYAGRLHACSLPGPADRAACAGAGLLAPRGAAHAGVLAPRAWAGAAGGGFDGLGAAARTAFALFMCYDWAVALDSAAALRHGNAHGAWAAFPLFVYSILAKARPPPPPASAPRRGPPPRYKRAPAAGPRRSRAARGGGRGEAAQAGRRPSFGSALERLFWCPPFCNMRRSGLHRRQRRPCRF